MIPFIKVIKLRKNNLCCQKSEQWLSLESKDYHRAKREFQN